MHYISLCYNSATLLTHILVLSYNILKKNLNKFNFFLTKRQLSHHLLILSTLWCACCAGGCAAALPMVERVGLVTGDLRVLGGEGEADLPEKKDRSCDYQL